MLLRTFFTIFISLHFQSALAVTMDFNIEQGKELYVENCITCHMENLSGHPKWKSELDEEGQRQAPPLNGTGHTWHLSLIHI